MRLRQLMVTAVAFSMVGVVAPTRAASASDLKLRIENLTTGEGVVISDAVGAISPDGGDEDGTEHLIVFTGPDFNFTLGQSRSEADSAGLGFLSDLSLFSFRMNTADSAVIRLVLEDTGFPGPPNGAFTNALTLKSKVGDLGSSGPVSIDVKAYATPLASGVPALGSDQGTWGSLATNPMGTGDTTLGISQDPFLNPVAALDLDYAPNYSLFTVVTLSFTGPGSISFTQDSTLWNRDGALVNPTDTPEPASLMLISTGILSLAGVRRRFKLPRP